MIKAVMSWFDSHPGAYWLIAWGAQILFCAWAFVPAWRGVARIATKRAGIRERASCALLTFLALLAWRWPVLLNPWYLSPDESQQIAGALTLAHHPSFWEVVDGGTAGPLNYFVLLPLHLLGIPLDFFEARLTGLLLIVIAVLGLRRALEAFYGEAVARVGCVPVVFFFCFATDQNFLHLSTEHVPLALVATAAGMVATLHATPGLARRRSLIALGVVLGSLPWAKLQAAPFGFMLGAMALASLLLRPAVPWKDRLVSSACLIAAALFPSIVALAVILGTDQWTHFTYSYILYNRHYLNAGLLMSDALRLMWSHTLESRIFPCFAIPAIVAAVAGSTVAFAKAGTRTFALASFLFVAVALFVVAAPHRDFPHYLLFLIIPIGLWTGGAFGAVWQKTSTPLARHAVLAVFATCTLLPPVVNRALGSPPTEVGQLLHFWRNPYSPVGGAIRALTRPADTLVVWGWDPQLYVEAGLAQGTRDAHTQRQIETAPLQEYYRQRFLDEMRHNQPAVFVDAVTKTSFAFTDPEAFGHESFSQLASLVRENYVLRSTIDGARIYLRRDLEKLR